jgi:hypothetical protein
MKAPAAHPHHALSPRLTAMLRAARVCAGAMAELPGAVASAFARGCIRASRPSRPLLVG